MFCKNCGNELADEVKFCNKCGASVDGEIKQKEKKVEDKTVKYQIKPNFKWGYKLITNLGYALLIILLALGSSIELILDEVPELAMIIIGGTIVFVLIKLFIENVQYKNLEYNFYATKVQYKDGFLNKEEKELKYKFIREVTMHQNILERMFGIGTIRLFTNASSGYGYGARGNMLNGINIHCVDNVNEQFKKVRELIDEATED